MGRKSRAKAAHRAALANITGRELTPSTVAELRQRADAEAGWAPMLSPGTTRPLRTVATPSTVSTHPPRAVPVPPLAAPQQIYDPLKVLVARRDAAQKAVDDEVRALVRQGCSWPAIGRALGVSRQGARQRYRRLLANDDVLVHWAERRDKPSGAERVTGRRRLLSADARTAAWQACRAGHRIVGKRVALEQRQWASVSHGTSGSGQAVDRTSQGLGKRPDVRRERSPPAVGRPVVRESSRAPSRLAGPPAHR